MADLQYFVVRTDEGEIQVFYGRERPVEMPKNANEMVLRFVPSNWKILHSCADDESAEKKLKEELAKLPDQKKGQAKSDK